ncbi:MAG: VOC family protein [Solirubrobacterales bacterium]
MADAVPYLAFDGNAAEAMAFYNSVFGGELITMTFGESPMESPAENEDKLMHSDLWIDDFRLFACDDPEGAADTKIGNPSICVVDDDEAKLDGWFKSLSEGSEIILPFGKQFWGDTFGMLKDQYGVRWMFNANTAHSTAADG